MKIFQLNLYTQKSGTAKKIPYTIYVSNKLNGALHGSERIMLTGASKWKKLKAKGKTTDVVHDQRSLPCTCR
jgi:hypothetical protein